MVPYVILETSTIHNPHFNFVEATRTIINLGLEPAFEIMSDSDLETQQLLLAASQHDIRRLQILLRRGSASAQDPETGFTPLHAAIAACEPPSSSVHTESRENGHQFYGLGNSTSEDDSHGAGEDEIQNAAKTMKLLLENGAIWNDVDMNNETPGCLALRLGLKDLYAIMVDAGVRAEILLNRLDEYEMLSNGQDSEETEGVEKSNGGDLNTAQENSSDIQDAGADSISRPEPDSDDYLRSSLTFHKDKIVDGLQNGVMMAWEADIMKRTADLLVPKAGLRVLNVGHGMGIIDRFIQEKSPSAHHIIEAHPQVLAQMRKDGWYAKSNVTIHEGKWQDVVPNVIEQSVLFDAIYFDTFAEDYKALRDFFSDQIIGLLEDRGKWSFFNGLGADRQICYDSQYYAGTCMKSVL